MLIETKDYLTIQTFADKVGVSPNKVRHYINDGRLEAIDIDGKPYLHRDLIEKWPPQLKKTGPKSKEKG